MLVMEQTAEDEKAYLAQMVRINEALLFTSIRPFI